MTKLFITERHSFRLFQPNDRLRDIIDTDSRILLVVNRFGIPLGFGSDTVADTCRRSGIDTPTFLAVANLVAGDVPPTDISVSLPSLMTYLRSAHDYILNLSLPAIRRKIIESINCMDSNDVAFLILRYYDDYVAEVNAHMNYENDVIFPCAEEILAGKTPTPTQLYKYSDHHEDIVHRLSELRSLIINHYNQRDNNLLISAMMDITAVTNDLLSHGQVEDSLFIPRLRQLADIVRTANANTSAGNEHKPDSNTSTYSSDSSQTLTEREREIIGCVAQGLTNKEIADKLCLSFHTVTTHRRNIASKLQIHSSAGLAIYAIMHHIVNLSDIDISSYKN